MCGICGSIIRPEMVTLQDATAFSPVNAAAGNGAAPSSTMALTNPSFDIVINYTGANTYLYAFQQAEALWELVITGDLPNQGSVDDLQINASIVAIDGPNGILGQAGPTGLRGNNIPYLGIMEFDSADIANMHANGTLAGVIVHEMGHVLGLGTVWDLMGLRTDTASATFASGRDYRYIGANALAEYRILSNTPGATFVQVESNTGSPGSDGGHWAESLFTNELMTPFASGDLALSRLTLAALRDMGYQVDLGYADAYWLPTTPAQFRDLVDGNYNTDITLATGSHAGAIELSEDNDWYRVNLVAGTQYTFDLRGSATGGGTLLDPFLALRALNGDILQSNDNNGTNNDARITFTATTTGTFYLDASAATNAQTGSYTLVITGQTGSGGGGGGGGDDFAANTFTTGSVSINGSSTGNIEVAGDRDWFRVTLTAGTEYTFDLRGQPSGGGSLSDPILTLRDASGTIITSNDDFGGSLDSRIVFTATASGTYYLDAAAYGSNTGTYTVSTSSNTPPPTDDFAASTATTGVVAGGTATGNIEFSGDRDWFRMSVVAGRTYIIEALGATGGNGTLTDPTLTLRSATGTVIDSNDNFGNSPNSRITYTATATGNVFLDVGGADTGTYRVRISTGPAGGDDFAGSTATTGTIAVGGVQNGVIERSGDRDWLRITLTAGQAVFIDMNGAEINRGTLIDPLVSVRGASGQLLLSDDNSYPGAASGRDARIVFNPNTSGTYYIDLGSVGGDIGSYQARVTNAFSAGNDVVTITSSAQFWRAGGGNDTVTGTSGNDRILGEDGNDNLFGGAGNDVLDGGLGNDRIEGGEGDDTIRGGGGTDTALYTNATSGVQVDLSILTAQNTVGAGVDILNGIRNVEGSAHADTLTGDQFNNVLSGLAGDDTLYGGGGLDVLIGGPGRDTLYGGANNDRFLFESIADIGMNATRDRIMDFTSGDRIDLRPVDANTNLGLDQAFVLLAANNASFTGAAGQLRWFTIDPAGTANDLTIIEGDVNGDGVADFQLELAGLHTVTSAYFYL